MKAEEKNRIEEWSVSVKDNIGVGSIYGLLIVDYIKLTDWKCGSGRH